jgi:hypothetical protein
MTKVAIGLLVLVVGAGLALVPISESLVAYATAGLIASCVTVILRHNTDEKDFVTGTFLLALALRLMFGLMVHIFDLQDFFGADANTYDAAGWDLVGYWSGSIPESYLLLKHLDSTTGVGYGMIYFVAAIYTAIGHNLLAAQSICAIIGAVTAPMAFFCSKAIYQNNRVAKFAAITVAVFPSFVIWSAQLMKDGIIIFLLVVAMTAVVQLQRKLSFIQILALAGALVGIFALRFYIFFPVMISCAGTFFIGIAQSTGSIVRRLVVVGVLGVALNVFGIYSAASEKLEFFGNLDRVQVSRKDLASANSGFNEDLDVSTPSGALAALPLGLTYLLLAPFPWQATNLRQAITIPEVLVWWAVLPLAAVGLLYTVRNKLRAALPVLIFSVLLTVAYSIFQGNVGTAYRQRTQIQVFLFIMAGVGWTLRQEKRENERVRRQLDDQRLRAARRPGIAAQQT